MDIPAINFDYPEEYYNTRSAEQVLPIVFDMYKPASILDVGCGNGTWLEVAGKLGVTDIMGIDLQSRESGKWPLGSDKFASINLQQPFDLLRKFDMILCLEVAEHLPEKAAYLFIDSLVQHSDFIVFSAAIPGQEGDHHIHLCEPAYWQQLFNLRGYKTYDCIRPRIWDNDAVFWWYRQNIFIAQREKDAEEIIPEKIHYLIHPELYFEKMDKINRLENERDSLEKTLFIISGGQSN
jgi:SAM-dependent methyltransferase